MDSKTEIMTRHYSLLTQENPLFLRAKTLTKSLTLLKNASLLQAVGESKLVELTLLEDMYLLSLRRES